MRWRSIDARSITGFSRNELLPALEGHSVRGPCIRLAGGGTASSALLVWRLRSTYFGTEPYNLSAASMPRNGKSCLRWQINELVERTRDTRRLCATVREKGYTAGCKAYKQNMASAPAHSSDRRRCSNRQPIDIVLLIRIPPAKNIGSGGNADELTARRSTGRSYVRQRTEPPERPAGAR